MDGPTYHASSPLGVYEDQLCGLECDKTLVLGGAIGVIKNQTQQTNMHKQIA